MELSKWLDFTKLQTAVESLCRKVGLQTAQHSAQVAYNTVFGGSANGVLASMSAVLSSCYSGVVGGLSQAAKKTGCEGLANVAKLMEGLRKGASRLGAITEIMSMLTLQINELEKELEKQTAKAEVTQDRRDKRERDAAVDVSQNSTTSTKTSDENDDVSIDPA